MAGELVSFGIQKLWDLLSHEHEQFQGVKDQITELKTDLNTLKSFMKDADAKKHTSARVRNCVEVIKEIIFDAEDIIETYILKDELGKNGGIKKRVRRLACIIPEQMKVALEIGRLSKRISKVIRDMETIGVQQIIADMRDPQPLQERQEFAREYESNLVGLEANVETLVRYLVEEDNVPVVSMTGMGGLGKTTLAGQTFHHKMVKKTFDRLAWVCVSQVCDRKNVWQTILQSFKGEKLPFIIGNLIHLRYLSLEAADTSHLPSSLGNLKLLIYLNLKVAGESRFVPNVLMEMKELRYLALPWSMHKKTKLELSLLVNLETLENFSTENCSLEDLRGMTRLRSLQIFLTGESSFETLSASIDGLRHLEYLSIKCSGAKGTKEGRSLFEFNNIQHLELVITNIPLLSDELQLPSPLRSLFLMECRMEEDPMPILEKLGQLKVVFLQSNAFCGRRMVCFRGGFPQLQELGIDELEEWEEWIVEEGSMPLLHTLNIWYCKKLKELEKDKTLFKLICMINYTS